MVKEKMNLLIIVIIVLVLMSVSAVVFATGHGEQPKTDTYADFEGLKSLLEDSSQDYFLVDVRTDQEYEAGHIPTAANIPFDVIASNLPSEDKDALIIVYCRSGNRSGKANKTLSDLGYTNIYDFGAYSKWKNEFIQGSSPGTM